MDSIANMEAETVTSIPADYAARSATLDIRQSCIVEAPAGSGKTELLMQRFLKLLPCVDEPEQVLAITFTRKSAAEMRERILQALRDAESHAPIEPGGGLHKQQTRDLAVAALAADNRNGWNLTRQPQRLNIRTIDSLCSQIVSRLPLLSRMGAEMRPIENASELYRTAAKASLQEAADGDPRWRNAVRVLLLHIDNRMEAAIGLLAEMLRTRDQWGRVFPIEADHTDEEFDAIIRERFEIRLECHVASVMEKACGALDAPTWAQVFDLVHYAAARLEESGRSNPFSELLHSGDVPPLDGNYLELWQAAICLLVTKENTLRKPTGIDVKLGFGPKDPRKAEIKNLIDHLQRHPSLAEACEDIAGLPKPAYSAAQREVLRSIFMLLRKALAHLQIAFADAGCGDFIELSLGATNALRDDANSVALSFGTTIQHLLVDEMQDTSLTQFEMFSKLVEGWDGRSQTVFLVGDPKQSIYRFRQVEVALFRRAVHDGLGGIELQHVRLTANFRSRQGLVAASNEYFERIFEDPQRNDGILFEHSEAAHREEFIDRAFWHPHIISYRGDAGPSPTDEAAEHSPADVEASEVCDIIERHRTHPAPDGKSPSIAVLVRARNHADGILAEMRLRNIPYRAIEFDTLEDRQPVRDLLALARCLLHFGDRIAWLAVLRAPWCGLLLADLHALTGSDDAKFRDWTVPELLAAHIDKLSAEGQLRARRAWEALESALARVGDESIALLVERTWHTLGGPACLPPSDVPAANEFFRMLQQLENDRDVLNAANLEAEMRKLYATVDAAGKDPVEVLTYFKAKGLEWDVVLLPGLHRETRRNEKKLVLWYEQMLSGQAEQAAARQASTIFLSPIQHVSQDKEPIAECIAGMIAARDRAELNRLFYVGCTRARQYLHLFGACDEKKDHTLAKPAANSLLRAAWVVAEAKFGVGQEPADRAAAVAGNVVTMRRREETVPLSGMLDTVAAGSRVALRNFRRLPAGWHPPAELPNIAPATSGEWPDETGDEQPPFSRAQGSWKVRASGTAVHAFLGLLANALSQPADDDAVAHAIGSMARPIALQLMRSGFSAKDAQTEAARIQKMLIAVAHDPCGRWLLSSHRGLCADLPPISGFEVPFTSQFQGALRSIRVDRLFLAGPEPLADEGNCIWIVDFKSSSHGGAGIDAFLDSEREQYMGQMQTYATVLHSAYPAYPSIRLGLYYPMLRRFVWWQHEG